MEAGCGLDRTTVTHPAVPEPVRESLSLESGLNDGICVPVILFLIALASGSVAASESIGFAVGLPLEVIGIGLATGVLLAAVVGIALQISFSSRAPSSSPG